MMKHTKSIYLLTLALFIAAVEVHASESTFSDAESDQIRIDQFVTEHYAPFIRDYLSVFSNDFECDYDFVDSTDFDELADRALKSLVSAVKTVMKERSLTLELDFSPEQLNYSSSLVALSSLEKHVNMYTEELQVRGFDTNSCESQRMDDKALYESFPAWLEKISKQKI